ncbi:PD-(D/E)XK motif protein [Cellulomonas sp. ES6]|uniref:PD-(D/E)XK motif protein n=1 Tax=Cellulomonas sp. ES6 TaxID=3039384 RepID=UPI0024B84AE1|nr:PD-(D/E)XK motif protein [Cellulomonas sp. ES6]WHP18903.1 PD-(D/E)XK motif protein [Cellulomonas sp. ES6]
MVTHSPPYVWMSTWCVPASRGGRAVLASEIDPAPAAVYERNWGLRPEGDVTLLAADAATRVEAWHVDVGDRFDFAVPSARIEVKTTQAGVRVHEFDLTQLEPVEGAVSTVVSIVTTPTHAGASVLDLVNEVQERLGARANLAVKLWQIVAATVGEDWIADTAGARWDRDEGAASLRVMRAASIPRVMEPLDQAILSVRLRVLCENLPLLPRSISLAPTW